MDTVARFPYAALLASIIPLNWATTSWDMSGANTAPAPQGDERPQHPIHKSRERTIETPYCPHHGFKFEVHRVGGKFRALVIHNLRWKGCCWRLVLLLATSAGFRRCLAATTTVGFGGVTG